MTNRPNKTQIRDRQRTWIVPVITPPSIKMGYRATG